MDLMANLVNSQKGMHTRVEYLMLSCLLFLSLTGCSVGMAMSGKPDPNISVLEIGQSRDIVILNLGQPTRTSATEEGRTDVFYLERGNQQSVGRAAGHAAMDVLTFGLWEIIGTPIEGFTGDEFMLSIEYDGNNKVKNLKTSPGHSNF